MSAVTGPVAFVLKGYPRLSETFIAQEIRALEECGLDIRIVSLRHPTDPATHPVHREIRAPVLYLPEYLYQEPRRVWRGWRAARQLPGYRVARRAWLADLVRDRTPNRIRRFGQALVLAAEAPETIIRFHAHFMHTPGSVARYTAMMRGQPFSISAHAKDIWTIPTWEKKEKLAAADWTVTCTSGHRYHLADLTEPGKVTLSYHGLNLDRFPPRPEPRNPKDGSDAFNPVVILSVGRAVEKKGYDVLLRALARVPTQSTGGLSMLAVALWRPSCTPWRMTFTSVIASISAARSHKNLCWNFIAKQTSSFSRAASPRAAIETACRMS